MKVLCAVMPLFAVLTGSVLLIASMYPDSANAQELTRPFESSTAEPTMSLNDIAELLLDYWSRKDAAAVASLLCEDAVVTGPLAPAGRAQGVDATKRFLEAQNTDRSGLPAQQRPHHELMASSSARLKRSVEEADSIAVEADLLSTLDGQVRRAALFIDVDPQCGVKSVAIYFDALPD